jgi:hypothetical protein
MEVLEFLRHFHFPPEFLNVKSNFGVDYFRQEAPDRCNEKRFGPW